MFRARPASLRGICPAARNWVRPVRGRILSGKSALWRASRTANAGRADRGRPVLLGMPGAKGSGEAWPGGRGGLSSHPRERIKSRLVSFRRPGRLARQPNSCTVNAVSPRMEFSAGKMAAPPPPQALLALLPPPRSLPGTFPCPPVKGYAVCVRVADTLSGFPMRADERGGLSRRNQD
jgi:hypothetical protein